MTNEDLLLQVFHEAFEDGYRRGVGGGSSFATPGVPHLNDEAVRRRLARLVESQKIAIEDVTTFNLLHNLWTKAVGTPGYEKKAWQLLEARFLELERKLRIAEAEG